MGQGEGIEGDAYPQLLPLLPGSSEVKLVWYYLVGSPVTCRRIVTAETE